MREVIGNGNRHERQHERAGNFARGQSAMRRAFRKRSQPHHRPAGQQERGEKAKWKGNERDRMDRLRFIDPPFGQVEQETGYDARGLRCGVDFLHQRRFLESVERHAGKHQQNEYQVRRIDGFADDEARARRTQIELRWSAAFMRRNREWRKTRENPEGDGERLTVAEPHIATVDEHSHPRDDCVADHGDCQIERYVFVAPDELAPCETQKQHDRRRDTQSRRVAEALRKRSAPRYRRMKRFTAGTDRAQRIHDSPGIADKRADERKADPPYDPDHRRNEIRIGTLRAESARAKGKYRKCNRKQANKCENAQMRDRAKESKTRKVQARAFGVEYLFADKNGDHREG